MQAEGVCGHRDHCAVYRFDRILAHDAEDLCGGYFGAFHCCTWMAAVDDATVRAVAAVGIAFRRNPQVRCLYLVYRSRNGWRDNDDFWIEGADRLDQRRAGPFLFRDVEI